MEITIKKVKTKRDLNKFIKLPWKIYKNDKNWVPPLISQMKATLNPKKNPFFKHSEVQLFIAEKNGKTVGRISAQINRNHNKFHNEKSGSFGFFECIPDYKVASALFQEACDWAKSNPSEKMEIIRGPMNFCSNDEWGLLVKGFDSPPLVMMTYNPEYYTDYFDKFGFEKSKDLLAYYADFEKMPERFERIMKKLEKKKRFVIRKLNPKKFKEEVATLFEVYNKSWEYNWGFVPMDKEEFMHTAKDLKSIIDYDLVFIAEIDGKPVGFSLTLPDINQALIKINGRLFPFGLIKLLRATKQINRVRTLALGTIKEYTNLGIDLAFYYYSIKNALPKNCARGEASWILEDNMKMRRPMERAGAKLYKTYRIYEKKLK